MNHDYNCQALTHMDEDLNLRDIMQLAMHAAHEFDNLWQGCHQQM
jgi:hypothetical protein